MATYDFRRSPNPDRDAVPVVGWFREHVGLARQIIYDLTDSVPRPGDEVSRNQQAEDDWKRQQLGLHLAMVYLVSRLDFQMCDVFRDLWGSRRDLLEIWVADHFGSSAADEDDDDDGSHDKRERRRGKRKVNLPLQFSDVWSPRARRTSLEDYVRDAIFAKWDAITPKSKIKALTSRLLPGVPLEPTTTEALARGLDFRNRFVHPRPEMPPTVSSAANQPRRVRVDSPPTLNTKEFDRFVEAVEEFVLWLSKSLTAVNSNWIATNDKGLVHDLSDAQSLALGGWRSSSGRNFETLDLLFSEIEASFGAKGPPPKALVLVLDTEVFDRLAKVEEIKAALISDN